ncbi:MAG: hypothetical protein AAFO29_19635 [Actinomycetota bacterium]
MAATALVVGASLVLGLQTEDDSGDGGAAAAIPSITAPSGPAAPVPSDRIVVAASSALVPDGPITYDPINTIDDNLDTAWNSDAPDADPRGELLTFRFTEPIDLTAIRFTNGYAKSEDIYAANHRIQQLWVRTDAGDQLVNLLDTSDEQEIAADFGFTSKVVLEIVEIYQGDGFDDPALTSDLALTEIDFVAVQR